MARALGPRKVKVALKDVLAKYTPPGWKRIGQLLPYDIARSFKRLGIKKGKDLEGLDRLSVDMVLEIGVRNAEIACKSLTNQGYCLRMPRAYEEFEDAVRNVQGHILSKSPIEFLCLPEKIEKCLRNAGIRTVEELLKKTEAELCNIRGIGPKSLNEIGNVLGNLFPLRYSRNYPFSQYAFRQYPG
jgi:hypothetical protein